MNKKLNEDEIDENSSGITSIIENSLDKKIIYIVGEINEDVANTIITNLLETNWDEGIKEIHLYITSSGGYLANCFAITDLLLHIKKRYNIKIFTYGLGEVASAGFFIFISGDNRIIFPSCRIFVHTHITINNIPETYQDRIKADKTDEKEIYDNYVKYTATQLNLSVAKSKNLLKKSKWLNQKEIKDYNIGKEIENGDR